MTAVPARSRLPCRERRPPLSPPAREGRQGVPPPQPPTSGPQLRGAGKARRPGAVSTAAAHPRPGPGPTRTSFRAPRAAPPA